MGRFDLKAIVAALPGSAEILLVDACLTDREEARASSATTSPHLRTTMRPATSTSTSCRVADEPEAALCRDEVGELA